MSYQLTGTRPLLMCLCVLGLLGCEGEVTQREINPSVSDEKSVIDPMTGKPVPKDPVTGLPSKPDKPSDPSTDEKKQFAITVKSHPYSPGLRRLSRASYIRTIDVLTGIDLNKRDLDVPWETLSHGDAPIAGAQVLQLSDIEAFEAIGQEIATLWVPDLVADTGCKDATCWQGWGETFLDKAWRQGSPKEVKQRYLGLLSDERAGKTVESRVEGFLIAAFMSPYFLYRREIGEEQVEGEPKGRWLSDAEVATRMSYLLWGSPPDEVLIAAAKRGELRTKEGRVAQFERMFKDDRIEAGLAGFASYWVDAIRNKVGEKDKRIYKGQDPEKVAASARASFEALVARTLREEDKSFVDLLRAGSFPADQFIGPLIGEISSSDELAWVDLNQSERVGVLTHPYVIAAHNEGDGVAFIFRTGQFVYNFMLCGEIPPPAEVPPFEEGESDPEATQREKLEAQTSKAQCAWCHARIGPPGWAFQTFDTLGRYKAADPLGRAYDVSGVIPVGEDQVEFEDVISMSKKLADHPATAQCTAHHLFRWGIGRHEQEADRATLGLLREASTAQDASARRMLKVLIESDTFIQTLRKEEP